MPIALELTKGIAASPPADAGSHLLRDFDASRVKRKVPNFDPAENFNVELPIKLESDHAGWMSPRIEKLVNEVHDKGFRRFATLGGVIWKLKPETNTKLCANLPPPTFGSAHAIAVSDDVGVSDDCPQMTVHQDDVEGCLV